LYGKNIVETDINEKINLYKHSPGVKAYWEWFKSLNLNTPYDLEEEIDKLYEDHKSDIQSILKN